MEFLKFLAWLLLNVGVPLLAPIALLPLVYVSSKHRGKVGTLVRRALQEGQLFWTVIAMCAAACYEAAAHVAIGQDQEIDRAITSIAVGWHVVVIVASSVLVCLGLWTRWTRVVMLPGDWEPRLRGPCRASW